MFDLFVNLIYMYVYRYDKVSKEVLLVFANFSKNTAHVCISEFDHLPICLDSTATTAVIVASTNLPEILNEG